MLFGVERKMELKALNTVKDLVEMFEDFALMVKKGAVHKLPEAAKVIEAAQVKTLDEHLAEQVNLITQIRDSLKRQETELSAQIIQKFQQTQDLIIDFALAKEQAGTGSLSRSLRLKEATLLVHLKDYADRFLELGDIG